MSFQRLFVSPPLADMFVCPLLPILVLWASAVADEEATTLPPLRMKNHYPFGRFVSDPVHSVYCDQIIHLKLCFIYVNRCIDVTLCFNETSYVKLHGIE